MIKISNEEVLFVKGSLTTDDSIGERSTCSFEVIDEGSVYTFVKGQPVEVIENNIVLFCGVIESIQERKLAHGVIGHRVKCIDYHYKADKRIIAKAYVQETFQNIVSDIVATYLVDEDITIGNIEDGPVIEEAVFNYVRVSDALDSLAEKTGFWWKIDCNKMIHFVRKETYAAPFGIDTSNIEKDSLTVENGNPQYRNKQYSKGGTAVTDPQTEVKRGDGDAQSFILEFPVAKVPTVEVSIGGGAWQQQTVGIRQLEEAHWHWSKGDQVISQNSDDSPLTVNDRLRVTYRGEFPIVAVSMIPEQIEDRKDIEGGTGMVEQVIDDPNISSVESAFELANAKLEKYGVIGRRVKFRTWEHGLESGQIVKATFPEHRLTSNELLIESISISKSDQTIWYNVTAVEGPVSDSWSKMFYHMATRGQTFVIRENISEEQILVTLQQLSKTWTEAESPNIHKSLRPTHKPNVKPMFKYEDRVKYLSFFDASDNEIFRKLISRRTGLDTNTVSATTFISPFEANGLVIASVGWWGGWKATEVNGTGVLVDKQPFDKVKNELEAIQIDKTDQKGW